jgi:hypothetical protein
MHDTLREVIAANLLVPECSLRANGKLQNEILHDSSEENKNNLSDTPERTSIDKWCK